MLLIDKNLSYAEIIDSISCSHSNIDEQIDEMFKCKSYNFLSLINNYYKSILKLKSSESFNETYYIIKLLCLCNNIIDSDLSFALILIYSEFFENLIKNINKSTYFSKHLKNRTIVESFLDTFIRLFGYFNKNIADNYIYSFNKETIYKKIES